MSTGEHGRPPATDDRAIEAPEEAVEVEVHVDAPPEEVFDYVADPARFPGDDGAVHLGRVAGADPPHRVVYEAEVEDRDAGLHPGTVEVTLIPDGDGTLVRVVHTLPAATLAYREPVALAA